MRLAATIASFAAPDMHLFDPTSGRRIEAAQAPREAEASAQPA